MKAWVKREMSRGVLRLEQPRSSTLAERPNNRWCEHCKRWIHKDLLQAHLKKEHGIVAAPVIEVTKDTQKTANLASTQRKRTTATPMNPLQKMKQLFRD